MRKYTTILLACLFLLSPNVVLSETVKFKDLVEKEGLYYKESTSVPFSGKVTGKTQGTLRNGKWNGSSESYHKNGQLGYKGNYKNGKKEGPWVAYYRNGTVNEKIIGIYKNGKKISD